MYLQQKIFFEQRFLSRLSSMKEEYWFSMFLLNYSDFQVFHKVKIRIQSIVAFSLDNEYRTRLYRIQTSNQIYYFQMLKLFPLLAFLFHPM